MLEGMIRLSRHTNRINSSFHLTPRDIEILERIAGLRFTKTSQILQLFGGGSKIRRRLKLMFDAGYLGRTYCNSSRNTRGGSSQIVYYLDSEGAKLLAARGTLSYGRLDWLQRHAKNESVEHGLMISEFLTKLELSCQPHEDIHFIPPFEAKSRILGKPKHLSWNVQAEFKSAVQKIGIVPDEVFGLQLQNQEPIFFFFEADRGTVPISTRNMFRTSMAKKLVGYHATMETGLLRDKWQLPFFKVITLTSSQKRLKNLLDINRQFNEGRGSGLFLFLDQESFRISEDLLNTKFESGFNHEAIRLDDLSHSWSCPDRTNPSPPLPLQWNQSGNP